MSLNDLDAPGLVAPELCYIRIETTEHWKKELLEQHRIKRIWDVYLYDSKSHTYCCEITPSYCLYLCDYAVEYEDDTDEELVDAADQEVSEAWAQSERTIYMHANLVDGHSDEDKDPQGITEDDEWGTPEQYDALIEEYQQAYRENPTW